MHLFQTVRDTLVSGFLALPIVLYTITGFLAVATANVGLILFFLAQLFVVPGMQFLLGFLRNLGPVQHVLNLGEPAHYTPEMRLAALSPMDAHPDQVMPPTSYWMANVVFFASYILSNAWALYSLPGSSTSAADTTKIENRKAQALTSFILTLAVSVVLIALYYSLVRVETVGSAALACVVYAPLGYGVFQVAKVCGLRTADIFGISTQMIDHGGADAYPFACVPITAAPAAP